MIGRAYTIHNRKITVFDRFRAKSAFRRVRAWNSTRRGKGVEYSKRRIFSPFGVKLALLCTLFFGGYFFQHTLFLRGFLDFRTCSSSHPRIAWHRECPPGSPYNCGLAEWNRLTFLKTYAPQYFTYLYKWEGTILPTLMYWNRFLLTHDSPFQIVNVRKGRYKLKFRHKLESDLCSLT